MLAVTGLLGSFIGRAQGTVTLAAGLAFNENKVYAQIAGVFLAAAIALNMFGQRPVKLIGFSLGG